MRPTFVATGDLGYSPETYPKVGLPPFSEP